MKANMNDTQYAKHRGVARQTVDRWRKRGFLVNHPDGGIHVKARPSTYRGGQASKAVGKSVSSEPDFSDLASVSLAEAQRRKECALAATRELALERLRGNVVLLTDIHPSWARQMLVIRTTMLSIPGKARLAMQLSDVQTEELRKIVSEALMAAATDTAPPIEGVQHGAA